MIDERIAHLEDASVREHALATVSEPDGPADEREAESGAAYVEFLISFLPVFTMFLCMTQLALMYAARLTVAHSANTAARAAVVVIPDDPQRYGGDPINQIRYMGAGLSHTSIQGVGSVLAYWGIIPSAPDSTDGNGSARLRAIRSAASMPLVAMSPSLDQMSEDKTVLRAVGGNPWGRLGTGIVLYNRAAVAVTFPASPRGNGPPKLNFSNGENVTTRVTYLFHCGVPIVSRWMCHDYVELAMSVPSVGLEQIVRRIAGDDLDRFYELLDRYRDIRGRDDLRDGMEELGFAEAPYLMWPLLESDSRFMILRAEATMPLQSASYPEYLGEFP